MSNVLINLPWLARFHFYGLSCAIIKYLDFTFTWDWYLKLQWLIYTEDGIYDPMSSIFCNFRFGTGVVTYTE